MNPKLILLVALLLAISSVSLSTRPEPTGPTQTKPTRDNTNYGIPGIPGGFGIPNIPPGWAGGYGAGYGGPNGGHAKSGVIRPSVVCKNKGPCYKKTLVCPAKCFSSYRHSGKNYGSGGGGGGCTIDCAKCVAYC